MTITIDQHGHPDMEALLSKLEKRINKAVSKIAQHSHAMDKHEPHTSSALAQAIRSEFDDDPLTTDDLKLEVYAEEFKSHHETECGADLYIGTISTDTYPPTSKGMLVQSKRMDSIRQKRERKRLRNQCGRMRTRAKDDAYVWVYINGEIRCIRAPKSSSPALTAAHDEYQTVGAMIANALRCNQGRRQIGVGDTEDMPAALKAKMEELGTSVLGFKVSNGSGR